MTKGFFIFSAALLLSVAANAKGATGDDISTKGGTSFVPIEQAQRVRIFPNNRNTTNEEGEILVCVRGFVTNSWQPGTCTLKDDAKDRWQPMLSLTSPGYEIVGFSYFYGGSDNSYRNLIVYFRKKP